MKFGKSALLALCMLVSFSANALDRDYICDQTLSSMINTINSYQKVSAVCSDRSSPPDVYQSARELARQVEDLYESQLDNCQSFCTRVPSIVQRCANDRGLSGACP